MYMYILSPILVWSENSSWIMISPPSPPPTYHLKYSTIHTLVLTLDIFSWPLKVRPFGRGPVLTLRFHLRSNVLISSLVFQLLLELILFISRLSQFLSLKFCLLVPFSLVNHIWDQQSEGVQWGEIENWAPNFCVYT